MLLEIFFYKFFKNEIHRGVSDVFYRKEISKIFNWLLYLCIKWLWQQVFQKPQMLSCFFDDFFRSAFLRILKRVLRIPPPPAKGLFYNVTFLVVGEGGWLHVWSSHYPPHMSQISPLAPPPQFCVFLKCRNEKHFWAYDARSEGVSNFWTKKKWQKVTKACMQWSFS